MFRRVIASAWNNLQVQLNRYDDSGNKPYHLAVLKQCLSHRYPFPDWVLETASTNAGATLRLLLIHHRFSEAAEVVLDLLQQPASISSPKPSLPFTQIDQLLLQQDVGDDCEEKLHQIRDLMRTDREPYSDEDADEDAEGDGLDDGMDEEYDYRRDRATALPTDALL